MVASFLPHTTSFHAITCASRVSSSTDVETRDRPNCRGEDKGGSHRPSCKDHSHAQELLLDHANIAIYGTRGDIGQRGYQQGRASESVGQNVAKPWGILHHEAP